MKKTKRFLAALLVIAMMVQLFALNAWAVEPGEWVTDVAGMITGAMEDFSVAEVSDTASYVIGELDDMREESVKHFRMNDGTYIAVDYGDAVHYQDENGNWQDIDNTLTQTIADSGSMLALDAAQENLTVFESQNGNETRQFAAVFQPGKTLFSMSNGTQGISMSVVLPENEEVVSPVNPGDLEQSEDTVAFPAETADAAEETDGDEPAQIDETYSELSEAEDVATVEAAGTEPAVDEGIAATEITQTAMPEAEITQTDAPATDADQQPVADEITQPEAEEASIMAAVENPALVQSVDAEEFQTLSLEEQVAPKRFSAAVSYENIWQDTVLLYQPSGRNVKESIVVVRPQDSYEYTFRLTLQGLTPWMNEDGSISLLDEQGVEVYYIPVPYMEDANGEFSESVTYELTEDEDGYLLRVVADSQ